MRKENIAISCKLIHEANTRIKRSMEKHKNKNMPLDLFLAINASALIIDSENNRIRRSIWRGEGKRKVIGVVY